MLTLDGDETWSVTLFATTGDAPLKALREPSNITRVVHACPLHAHWLDGTPIIGVLPIGKVERIVPIRMPGPDRDQLLRLLRD